VNALAEFAPVFWRSKQFDVLYHGRLLDAEPAIIDVTTSVFLLRWNRLIIGFSTSLLPKME
jgi:hypothetical protein